MHHNFLALVNTIMTNERISMAKSAKGSYILAVVCVIAYACNFSIQWFFVLIPKN